MSTLSKKPYLQGIIIPSLHTPPSIPSKSATPCDSNKVQRFQYDEVTPNMLKRDSRGKLLLFSSNFKKSEPELQSKESYCKAAKKKKYHTKAKNIQLNNLIEAMDKYQTNKKLLI